MHPMSFPNPFINTHTCIDLISPYLSVCFDPFLYIYIYIYRERERERWRDV